MSNKNKNFGGLVYSTDDTFSFESEEKNDQLALPNHKQNLKVFLDRKNRVGKSVSVVNGFVGSDEDIKELGSKIKKLCGVGGTVKDGEVLIQGDFRDKILAFLIKENYKAKKAGG